MCATYEPSARTLAGITFSCDAWSTTMPDGAACRFGGAERAADGARCSSGSPCWLSGRAGLGGAVRSSSGAGAMVDLKDLHMHLACFLAVRRIYYTARPYNVMLAILSYVLSSRTKRRQPPPCEPPRSAARACAAPHGACGSARSQWPRHGQQRLHGLASVQNVKGAWAPVGIRPRDGVWPLNSI